MDAYSAALSHPVRSLSAPANLSTVFTAHSSNASLPSPFLSSLAKALRRGASNSSRSMRPFLSFVGSREAPFFAALGCGFGWLRKRALSYQRVRRHARRWSFGKQRSLGGSALPEKEGSGQQQETGRSPGKETRQGETPSTLGDSALGNLPPERMKSTRVSSGRSTSGGILSMPWQGCPLARIAGPQLACHGERVRLEPSAVGLAWVRWFPIVLSLPRGSP